MTADVAAFAVLAGAAGFLWLLWRRAVLQDRRRRADTVAQLPDEGWRPLPADRDRLAVAPADAVGGRDWRVRYAAADTTTGLDLHAVAFTYTAPEDESGRISACTVVRVTSPDEAARPLVTVRPYAPGTAAVLRAVPVRLPGTGLDLGDKAFTRRFRTTADDPAAAAALLTPEIRRLLLADPRIGVRVHGSHLSCWGLWTGPQQKVDTAFARDRGVLRDLAVRLIALLPAA